MGLTYATTQLFNLAKTGAPYTAEFLVDTGAIDCMAPASELQKLGVTAEKQSDYELADGTHVSYPVGYARVTFIGLETVVPIIFGPDNCEPLLGVLALEGAGVGVDPISKNLKIMSSKPLKFMQKKSALLIFCGATIFLLACATISRAADFRFPYRAAESAKPVVNEVADEMADDVSIFSVSTIIRGQAPTMRGETPPQVPGLNLLGLNAGGLGGRSVSAAESELAIRPPDPLGAMDAAAIPEAIKPVAATAPPEMILPSETISPETEVTEIKPARSGEGSTLLLIFALAASGLAAYAIFVALDYKQRWEQALIQQNDYFLGGFDLEKESAAMPMPQW